MAPRHALPRAWMRTHAHPRATMCTAAACFTSDGLRPIFQTARPCTPLDTHASADGLQKQNLRSNLEEWGTPLEDSVPAVGRCGASS